MAGALEGISYELGGTLGVAILGSLVSSIYTRSFVPPVEAKLLPNASDSLDQTLIAAGQLPSSLAQSVVDIGKAAFSNGASLTLMGTAILTAFALCLDGLLCPQQGAGRRIEWDGPPMSDPEREALAAHPSPPQKKSPEVTSP